MALEDIESRLERLFERSLAKPFRRTLQPVEIAQRMVRELDLARQVTPQGLLAPNEIKVWLSNKDAQRFTGFQKALKVELTEALRQHALEEGYNFPGPISLHMFVDDELDGAELVVKTAFVSGESEPRVVVSDGSTYTVGSRPLVVGRTPECDITLNDLNVSRRHAEIWRTEAGVAIKDLDSTNGTIVNGHRVSAVSLSPRDVVQIGPVTLRIEMV